jgi:uncharacterized cysteine cluster protein YcgN (CxxCxxCC family)
MMTRPRAWQDLIKPLWEAAMRTRFWERFPLEQLSHEEWEALCDGCGRCCLMKLEDVDDGRLYSTDIACQYLDQHQCGCTTYADRFERVPDCVRVTPRMARDYDWLPSTCAYRRVAHGQGLADWHPLISGDPESVHAAGISVRASVVSETRVAEADYEDHVVRWV